MDCGSLILETLAILHVFGKRSSELAPKSCSNHERIVNAVVRSLRNSKSAFMRSHVDRYWRPAELQDCVQSIINLRPRHVELSPAYRNKFVKNLNANNATGRDDLTGYFATFVLSTESIHKDIGIERMRYRSFASSRLNRKQRGNGLERRMIVSIAFFRRSSGATSNVRFPLTSISISSPSFRFRASTTPPEGGPLSSYPT